MANIHPIGTSMIKNNESPMSNAETMMVMTSARVLSLAVLNSITKV